MAFSYRLGATVAKGFALAFSFCVLAYSATWAQVGPQMPPQREPVDSPVTKALTKFLKSGKKDATNEEEPEEQVGPSAAPKPKGNGSLATPPNLPMAGPMHEPLLTQPPLTNAKIEAPQVDTDNPPVLSHPKLDDPTNPLGFADAENKLKRLMTLIDAKRYMEAKPGLMQLRQWLVDLTEAHIGLYKTLNQIPSAKGQAELEKELALQFAQLRDRTMVELSKVYIAEKEHQRAIKELVEVVKSQPKSRLGLYSYGLLQEMGFTEKLQLAQ